MVFKDVSPYHESEVRLKHPSYCSGNIPPMAYLFRCLSTSSTNANQSSLDLRLGSE